MMLYSAKRLTTGNEEFLNVYTNANGPAKYAKCASPCYTDGEEGKTLFDYLQRITSYKFAQHEDADEQRYAVSAMKGRLRMAKILGILSFGAKLAAFLPKWANEAKEHIVSHVW